MERAIGDIDLVVASSRYRETDVVAGAADQRALRIDELPLLAGEDGTDDGDQSRSNLWNRDRERWTLQLLVRSKWGRELLLSCADRRKRVRQ